ncbi:DUF4174 domain-containing protein [Vibrio sp. RE86]|uniref:DUF4174 domain-containing protein n=1 Tax=Vibrio sp. RE86 TaxID=2607605 RepID=UPI0014938D3F|nr:DUF4174 domain-containing protein [Vibrio sp. RE86]NOH79946.1 DUF4174 domain-containing protein [Vibrio sp. RE86]
MRVLLLLGLTLLASTFAWSYPAYSTHYQHRSVIYFAPTNDDHVKQFLLETLINECELQDRDLITMVVTEDGFTNPTWVKFEFNLKALFEVYQVKPGKHTTVLIGKDGHEKLRWGKQTDWNQVKQTIDSMPVRQYEMATQNNPCSA